MSSKVDAQWNIHEHLLTFIVVLHCWHEVDGSSGITGNCWLLLLSTLTHENLFKKYSGINTLSLLKVLQVNYLILLLLRGFFNHKVWLDKEILHVNPLPQLGTTILLRHVHQNCLCFLILYFLLTLLRYYQR